MLTDHQLRRYARNISLPGIGIAGQERLLAASVLVIGAGGLGSASLAYLAAAGIGHIGIIDHDRVELSNLQRQVLFEQADIGRLKVEAARDRMEELNPDVRVTAYPEKIDPANAEMIIRQYDIIADGSDNFATRLAVNHACHRQMKTLVSAAIRGFDGQLMVFRSYQHDSPCYRCFAAAPQEDGRGCRDTGVIGALAGMMGSMQALEVIKEITGTEPSLAGKLLVYNALSLHSRIITIAQDPACECCGSG